ncbi:hypothetical protein DTO195F2_528 [Paecilomyces variotii]|nr:hypothetical protein DTO195F2_528 [Paecilomyces variotii]
MLCLRCSRALPSAFNASSRITAQSQILRFASPTPSARTFSSLLTNQRPALSIHRAHSPIFSSLATISANTTTTPSATLALAHQSRSFSASASLGAKRDTYNPSRRVQKRRHGFLARLRSRGGRKVLLRRRAKGRKFLSW